MYYKLTENKKVVKVNRLTPMQSASERRVGLDQGESHRVSTVFLAIDHSFANMGPPVVFETMVFPRDDWGEIDCQRYSTYEEAVEGHRKMCKKWNVEPKSLDDADTQTEDPADAIYELFIEDEDD